MKQHCNNLVNWVEGITLIVLFLVTFPFGGFGNTLEEGDIPTTDFHVAALLNCDKSASMKATYFYRDTVTKPLVGDSLGALDFIYLGAGMPHTVYNLRHRKPLKVAFLGGSITHMKGWRNLLMAYLTKTYPGTHFEFLEAGIPSLGSVPHAFRLQQDVLDKMRPDLLFIEAAVNDEGNGTTKTEQLRALEGIVRHALSANNQMDIILMAFADEVKNEMYAHGQVPVTVQMHEKVATYYQLPFINLAKEVYTRITQGAFSWEKDFKSLHPAPFGQALYFHAIRDLIEQALHNANSAGQKKTYASIDRPAKTKLPKPMQKYSYTNGRYVDVKLATHLEGFQYINNWTPEDKARVRPGFVHVPVLAGTTPGDKLHLDFEGTAVGIAVAAGPDAGAIAYRIDHGPWQYMDLYTKWSGNLHLPWYELLADGLKDKTHQLIIKITDRQIYDKGNAVTAQWSVQATANGAANHSAQPKQMGTGTAVRIVHFLVNDPHIE